MTVVVDNRIGNAVLRRIAKEQGCNGEVYMDSRFHYVNVLDTDDIFKISFASILYHGHEYKIEYFDGCFNPFLVIIF